MRIFHQILNHGFLLAGALSAGLISQAIAAGPTPVVCKADLAPLPPEATWMDAQVNASKFDTSRAGNLAPTALKGDAAKVYALWNQSSVLAPPVSSFDANGTPIWVVSGLATTSEFSSAEPTAYIAVFSASDGKLIAEGPVRPLVANSYQGVAWEAAAAIHDLPTPTPFAPKLEPLQSGQTQATLLDSILGSFDEVAMKNRIYPGQDASGNALKMNWNLTKDSQGGRTLAVQFSRGAKVQDSFVLAPDTKIVATNAAENAKDSEGTYLVIQSAAGASLWVHSFESSATIKITTGQKTSVFNFDPDI